MKHVLPWLLTLMLAGCLSIDPATQALEPVPSAFEDHETRVVGGFHVLVGQDIILDRDPMTVDLPGLTEEDEVQVLPGGGQEHTLQADFEPQRVTARLPEALHAGAQDVEWYLLDAPDAPLTAPQVTLRGGDPFPFEIGNASQQWVQAVIRNDDGAVRLDGAGHVAPILQWTVHGRVYPQSQPVNGASPDAMADRFTVEIPTPDRLLISTRPREGADGMGEDVDAAIYVDGKAEVCEGTGSPTPTHESASLDLASRTASIIVTFRIGHLTNACGSWSYDNQGPVDYSATFTAMYGLRA